MKVEKNGSWFNAWKRMDKPVPFPKSCQQMLQVKAVSNDGIFQLENNKYSYMWIFEDIPYKGQTVDEQSFILLALGDIYDLMYDSFKVIINNTRRTEEEFREDFYLPDGAHQDLRDGFNRLIDESFGKNKTIKRKKYLLVLTERNSIDAARIHFSDLDVTLKNKFEEMGSSIRPLSIEERIGYFREFFHPEDRTYTFDFEKTSMLHRDWRNDVVPSGIQIRPHELETDGHYYRCMYVSMWPESGIADDFISSLAALPYELQITIDASPIPADIVTRRYKEMYMSVSGKIDASNQEAIRHNQMPSENYYLNEQKNSIIKAMSSRKTTKENTFFVSVLLCLRADTKEELERITADCQSIARVSYISLDCAWLRQMEVLVTGLPTGVRQMHLMRTMQTQNLAALMPFCTKDILDHNGLWVGKNKYSNQAVIMDRMNLANMNALILGISGSGKSATEKLFILQAMLRYSKHRFIFIDPQGERKKLVEAMGGIYISFGIGENSRINPLGYNEEEISTEKKKKSLKERKVSFLSALIDANSSYSVSGEYRSVISRVTNIIYDDAFDRGTYPQLGDIYHLMQQQPDVEAVNMSKTLEGLVNGPLNIFNCQSTVDINNRIVGFDFDQLTPVLLPTALLVVMEFVAEKIQVNHQEGNATWIEIDELHRVTQYPTTARYCDDWFKTVRKRSALITAMTQNVVDIAKTPELERMISNSEFLALMRQSKADIDYLIKLTGMDGVKLKKLINAPKGTGIIKYGSMMIEFDGRISEDNPIYSLINTDGNQKKFADEYED